ncbi:uncharacterized protein TNCV_2962351 [Trichonephila clavipes]|nr:uncharacterized protein TNCV_2962351 [Trichonephila clavipes]
MIPDMLDWRQIWRLGRPRKGIQFPRAWHHFKRRRRWVGVKGSTRNELCDPKCSSARYLHMVREDTGAPSKSSICVWMVADKAFGYTRAFLTMWRSSRRIVSRVRPEPSIHVNDIYWIRWSQHLLTIQSEWRN